MTVELMSVVTIISVFFAVYFGINNARRNKSQDDKSDATLLTTLNVNQNVMQKSLDEIKFDVKGCRMRFYTYGRTHGKSCYREGKYRTCL